MNSEKAAIIGLLTWAVIAGLFILGGYLLHGGNL